MNRLAVGVLSLVALGSVVTMGMPSAAYAQATSSGTSSGQQSSTGNNGTSGQTNQNGQNSGNNNGASGQTNQNGQQGNANNNGGNKTTPCTAQELTNPSVNVSHNCLLYLQGLSPTNNQNNGNNSSNGGNNGFDVNSIADMAKKAIKDALKEITDDGKSLPNSVRGLTPGGIAEYLSNVGENGSNNSKGMGSGQNGFDPSSLLSSFGSMFGNGGFGSMFGNGGFQNPFSGITGGNQQGTSRYSSLPYTQQANQRVADAVATVNDNTLSAVRDSVDASGKALETASQQIESFKEAASKAGESLAKAQEVLNKDMSGEKAQNELEALRAILEVSVAHTKVTQSGFESTVGAINANGQAIVSAIVAGNQLQMAQLEAMGAISAAQRAQSDAIQRQMANLGQSLYYLGGSAPKTRTPMQQ